jgi:cytochrome c oxidase cbb3-type subunit III
MSDAEHHGPGDEHVYDGIVEHDNKLPLWWQLTLYGAVVFALAYWFGRRFDDIPSPDQNYARAVAVQRAAEAERARARGTIDDDLLTTLARDPASVGRGKQAFVASCAPCHRADGGGNIGPNLTDNYWIHGARPLEVYRTISEGVPSKGMPTWGPQLGEDSLLTLAAYVISIRNTNVSGGKAPQGALASN